MAYDSGNGLRMMENECGVDTLTCASRRTMARAVWRLWTDYRSMGADEGAKVSTSLPEGEGCGPRAGARGVSPSGISPVSPVSPSGISPDLSLSLVPMLSKMAWG